MVYFIAAWFGICLTFSNKQIPIWFWLLPIWLLGMAKLLNVIITYMVSEDKNG